MVDPMYFASLGERHRASVVRRVGDAYEVWQNGWVVLGREAEIIAPPADPEMVARTGYDIHFIAREVGGVSDALRGRGLPSSLFIKTQFPRRRSVRLW
jgi:hypothetical protein